MRLFARCAPLSRRPEPPDPVVRLDRFQTLLARRPGDGEDLRLVSGLMSTACAAFATRDMVQAGDRLEVRILLFTGVQLRVRALVEEAVVERGQVRGVLLLEPDPEERRALLRHLERHAAPAA